MAENVAAVNVLVTLELAEASPQLRELIRELVRRELRESLQDELQEELAKPATAHKIAANIVQDIRLRGGKS